MAPKSKKLTDWDPNSAPKPFDSQLFTELWLVLLQMPKWRKKPISAIEMSVKRLQKFDEGFATILVENAIEGNYQGVVFTDSQKKYEEWKRQKQNNYGQKRIGQVGRTFQSDKL